MKQNNGRWLFRVMSVLALCATPCLAAEATAWLETGLPPLIDPAKEPPLTITSVSIKHNEFDQEILRAKCSRRWLVTTLPEEVKLVILPVRGGRYSVYARKEIVNSPFPPDEFGDVVGNLLNYRGVIPGGARIYLEMRAASPASSPPPQRLSAVYWLGTQEQLAEAQKSAPPEPAGSTAPALVPVPADVALPAGFPVRCLLGERWSFATVMEPASAGSPVKLLLFLVGPGNLYNPWRYEVPRTDVQVEPEALAELKANSDLAQQRETVLRQRLARTSAPRKLETIVGHNVEPGQNVLLTRNGWLEGAVVVTAPQNDVVRVRSSFDRRELDKQLIHVYLDPTPRPTATEKAPVAATSPPKGPPAPRASGKTAPAGLAPVTASMKLKKGDKLKTQWGGSWYDVEVMELLADGRVKIHWVGWSSNWDEARARETLFMTAAEAAKLAAASTDPAVEAQPFRTWTDDTGKSKIEAQLLAHEDQSIRLKRRDGREVTVPLSRLSAGDLDYLKGIPVAKPNPFEP